MVNAVNFFQPGTDPAIDMGAIQRQRAIADMLTQRGATPDQGQMVSGHYVAPGAGSYIAQLVAALGGAGLSRKADQSERDLATSLSASRAKDAQGIMEAMTGKAAVPASQIQPLTPNDDEGNPMPVAQTAAIPAQGPDMSKALAIALQSQDPAFRGMAPDLMKRQADAAEFQQAMAAAGGGQGAPAGGGPAPAGGGNTFGLDPAAFAFGASPNPRAQALAKMIQEAAQPKVLAEGGTLLTPQGKPIYIAPKTEAGIQINNGVASGVPGYGAAKAGQAGQVARATQGAESDNTMVTVDTAQGPKMMTRAQALQLANGGGQPAGYANEGQMRATAAGDMGQDPAALQRELSALRSDLQKVPDANSKRLIQDEITRLEGQGKTYGAGAGRGAQGGPGIPLQDDTQKRFGQQVASQSADTLIAGRDRAKTASDDLITIAQARKTINEGAYQGSGAETKLAIAKFINANVPGVNIDPAKVGNTDYLKSTLGEGILSKAKTLGANPTDTDAKRIESIVGDIGKDPKAMARLLDFREEMNLRAIKNHNAMVDDAEGRGLKSPFDLRMKPGASSAASSKFKIIGVEN